MTDAPKKTKLSDFTDDEIRQALHNAPESAKLHISTLKNELQNRMKRTAAQQGFMAYVNQVWPNFIHGRHHAKMAAAFERVRSAIAESGRPSDSIIYSAAQVVCVGVDEDEFVRRAAAIGREPHELRENGLAGTVDEVVAKARAFGELGATRIYLQVLDLGDPDHLELLGTDLEPARRAALDDDGPRIGKTHHVGIRHPVRRQHHGLVARIERLAPKTHAFAFVCFFIARRVSAWS